MKYPLTICFDPTDDNPYPFTNNGLDRYQQKGRLQKLLLEDGSLAGIQHYFIGNISAVKIDNMWKAVK
jgi:hypothetical protein